MYIYKQIIKKPPHFSYTKKRPHTIAEKNDNINMDSTIAGSVNAVVNWLLAMQVESVD
jgi:hypothetical protein